MTKEHENFRNRVLIIDQLQEQLNKEMEEFYNPKIDKALEDKDLVKADKFLHTMPHSVNTCFQADRIRQWKKNNKQK